MCGRFALRNPEPIKDYFHVQDLEGSFNIAPGQNILTLGNKPNFIRWGFTPYWAEKPFNLINARIETLSELPSFKNSNRCLIPADGWYEWKSVDDTKIPFFHYLKNNFFCFAGLYGGYRGKVGCAIVTIESRNHLRAIHKRMPLLLDKMYYKDWLNSRDIDLSNTNLAEKIKFHEVSTYVNNPQHDDARCIEEKLT